MRRNDSDGSRMSQRIELSQKRWYVRPRSAPSAPATNPQRHDESLVNAKQQLADAVEDLVGVLRAPAVIDSIGPVDRANLAKYLMIAKLKLENAIALVRANEGRD